jgi:hypothetical protein
MDKVQQQYEAYPYPARDPVDEAKRLIVGSPSNPVEVDHMIFGGKRNWKKPFRALFAGGGTGDALIMMAQKLSTAKCPAEITYLDMSTASRKVAEARAKARGLTNITFITGDLMTNLTISTVLASFTICRTRKRALTHWPKQSPRAEGSDAWSTPPMAEPASTPCKRR